MALRLIDDMAESGSRRSTTTPITRTSWRASRRRSRRARPRRSPSPRRKRRPAKGADVIDLMSLLKKSVEGGKKPREGKAPRQRDSKPRTSLKRTAERRDHLDAETPHPLRSGRLRAHRPGRGAARLRQRAAQFASSPRSCRAIRSSARSSAASTTSDSAIDYDAVRRAAEERRDRRGLHRAAEQPARRVRRCAPRAPACTCCARSRWR